MKVIKIGAIWCPGCLVMKKIWDNVVKNNDIDFVELDYDMDSDEVSKYNVGKILPVFVFVDDNGLELERLVGEQKESKLLEVIDRYRVI